MTGNRCDVISVSHCENSDSLTLPAHYNVLLLCAIWKSCQFEDVDLLTPWWGECAPYKPEQKSPWCLKPKKSSSQGISIISFWSHMTWCASIRRLTLRPGVWPWSAAPGCAWTSTGPRWRAVPSGWCWAVSAGPRQTATAPQIWDLRAERLRLRDSISLDRCVTTPLTF